MSRRVMVLAADPALEVSYELDRVDWAGPNRPATTAERPGGRGLTVARFLHALGAEVRLMGLLGGPAGQAVADAMAAAGVPGSFVPTSEPTRRTFTVTDTGRGQSAHFSEPGPVASPAEYAILRQRYEEEVPPAAIVLAGRMPLSLPPGAGRELALLAVAAGVPVVAALDGPALWESTAAKPDVLTTDLAGLEAAAGRPLLDGGPAAVLAAARELRSAGARAIVIWLGPRGALALTPDGVWRAAAPGGNGASVNQQSAGAAFMAGLTVQMVVGRPWDERLRHAVALGAAALAAPESGGFAPADYARLLNEVTVAPLPPDGPNRLPPGPPSRLPPGGPGRPAPEAPGRPAPDSPNPYALPGTGAERPRTAHPAWPPRS